MSSARSKTPRWPKAGAAVTGTVFFLAWFLYVWQRLEPAAGQYHSGPLFFMTYSFFEQSTSAPGGLLEYASAFLAQTNRSNGLGALASTAVAGLIYLATRGVVQRITGVRLHIAAFGPCFLWLLLLDRNEASAGPIVAGLLLTLGLALACMRFPSTKTAFRVAVAWLIAAMLFCAAGAWPCLLWICLMALFEGGRWGLRSAVACALSAMILPAWLAWTHSPKAARVFDPWQPGVASLVATGLYLFCPMAVLIVFFLQKRPFLLAGTLPAGQGKASQQTPPRWFRTPRATHALAASFLVAGWVLAWFGFDRPRWASALIDFYAGQGKDEAVMATAAHPQLKSLDAASEIRLHRALYHTGRLCEDLFAFPNQKLWELFPGLRGGLDSCRAQSDTLLELGLVNDAEHLAHEALEFEGARPDLLRRLAEVNVLKGRPRAAKIFLHVLSQIPFRREGALACLSQLESDPQLSSNPEVSEVRARLVSADVPHASMGLEELLTQLLMSNPKNRMAYEYLLAHYLLERDLHKLVERLEQLNRFGFDHIPRHCEEALLLCQQADGNARIEVPGYKIRPETVQRFQRFAQAMQQDPYRNASARAALAREFGGTFWYYFFTGQAGLGKSPAAKGSAS